MSIDTHRLTELYVGSESTIANDLRLNLKRIAGDSTLSEEEALLALYALAAATNQPKLESFAREGLAKLGLAETHIQEAREAAAMMGMLNTYYRFRYMLGSEDEAYKTAGLRMTALARPHLGKEKFEMLALAVSVVNGCQSCVRSHEQVLRDGGMEPKKIHDLAKLASVVKGLSVLAAAV